MLITIIATGSRGDIQPYIALGKGLKESGMAVRFVSYQNYESLITAYGLEFWPVEGDIQQIVQTDEMRQRIENGSFLHLMAQMAKEAQRGAIRLAEDSLAACRGADLLLTGMGGIYIGIAIAEKLKLPLLQAYLVPFSPTQEFPSVLAPNLPDFPGGAINRLSHHLTRQILWQGFRSADQVARREILGLPPAPFFGPYHSECLHGLPILYGFSPAVIPAPQDWRDKVQVTGYWFLDSPDAWCAPTTLLDFLEAGPPPIYIGFGSMSSRKPEETTDLVLSALRQSKQRGIMLSGWGGLKSSDLPDTVFMIDSIPHEWLFPRVAAVVHHGGAGTTAAGLKAGVPSVIIPYFGDQPFWGHKVATLGVGPQPIPRKKLTAERLTQAIEMAVQDQAMRQRAANLGAEIQSEDGIARAVACIKQL